jgi:hypothetical protein
MEIDETIHFTLLCFSALDLCLCASSGSLSDCRSILYEFKLLNQLMEIISKREREVKVFLF